MKLKTLKDLPIYTNIKINTASDLISSEEFHQEAIKWVKESKGKGFYCTICEKFNCDCGSSDCFKIYNLEEVVKWIKYFSNITEQDLEMKYRCPKCEEKVEWVKTGKTLFDAISQETKEFVKCSKCGFKAMRTVD